MQHRCGEKQQISLLVSLALGLLMCLAWLDGFELGLDGTLTWSDANDHPTNWLDTTLHPDVPAEEWHVNLW